MSKGGGYKASQLSRRTVLKAGAAAAAVAAIGRPALVRAADVIKIGHVAPQTGPIAGFAEAQSLFGGTGLSADTLGTITLLLIPVQVLLIVFAMRAFAQGWNVEQEVPIEEARKRGYNPPESSSSPPREPATA